MKSSIKKALLLVALSGSIVSCTESVISDVNPSISNNSNDASHAYEHGDIIPGQYIIQFEDATMDKNLNNSLDYKERKQVIKNTYQEISKVSELDLETQLIATYANSIKGVAATLSEEAVSSLRRDIRVKSIEPDRFVILAPKAGKGKPGDGGGGSNPQVTPWGITRVGGSGDGTGKTAWIIDSGIDLDHPDLNVDVARSVSFLSGGGGNSADDQNGHGTHVAGTVAALDNDQGVVGVAAGASVVAVRVLDRRGSGSTSGVIAGVDYAAASAGNGDVANMSLGGGVSSALDQAVAYAANTGLKFALAAGNESDDANNHSPARVNGANIYTVSAMDANDNFAYFSNYGAAVDVCAPGVSIESCWKSGGYNTINGTSMASPHMAGLLLMGVVGSDGTVNGDPDGNPDPIAHR